MEFFCFGEVFFYQVKESFVNIRFPLLILRLVVYEKSKFEENVKKNLQPQKLELGFFKTLIFPRALWKL